MATIDWKKVADGAPERGAYLVWWVEGQIGILAIMEDGKFGRWKKGQFHHIYPQPTHYAVLPDGPEKEKPLYTNITPHLQFEQV